MERIVFGPIPSRRFGQSLGINNVPYPKKCSYSCIYCQIGKTPIYQVERKEFYKPEEIKKQTKEVIENLKDKKIDFITFVPDGEPTLDINLGKEIEILKEFGIKIAVITNSSLIWREDVRNDLKKADCVSLKIDTVSKDIWEKINRPYKPINLEAILQGIEIFSEEFKGQLLTETLFIKDINDNKQEIEKIGEFLKKIKPNIAYIGYPTRPPAEKWVKIPEREKVDFAYIVFESKDLNVKVIEEKEKREFGFTGNLIEDILSIVSVHPMSEKEIKKFLKDNKGNSELLKELIDKEEIVEVEYRGVKYYRRNFK
ncbi:MAG: radical SAM protein [Candidatus Omnitrophica bacterium]|nr:radical SAM protein [Candidatus Omnitrophota bacterium]MCM8809406.1 radical SAM protein [Candidatus Omnitrophota bacterium]